MSDLFDAIPGQARAVEQLRGAVAAPVHAYLLVGPPGAGSVWLMRSPASCWQRWIRTPLTGTVGWPNTGHIRQSRSWSGSARRF